jgi:hypothetical protein
MRMLMAGTCVVLSLAMVAGAESAAQDKKDDPKYTISDVMQQGHKGGLLNKVVSGKASADDAKELLSMYQSMAKQKPPAGDIDSWKKKTEALVAATQQYVDGDKGKGSAALKKASNCQACHTAHKG